MQEILFLFTIFAPGHPDFSAFWKKVFDTNQDWAKTYSAAISLLCSFILHCVFHWRHCLFLVHNKISFAAPLCPIPPSPPASGSVVNNPLICPMKPDEKCTRVPGSSVINLACYSFLQLYIQSAVGGRVQIASYSPFCDMTKPLMPICTNTSIASTFRAACHGQAS